MAKTPAFIETLVTSTRIRLARNLAGYPFPQKLNGALAAEVVYLVENALKKLDEFTKHDVEALSAQEATLLQEQHLISPALIQRKGTAFISTDKCISVMVNEEDHLRQQYIYKGFDLFKAYERISALDEGLSSLLCFAYDEKIGYITACPSNVGTGMRASVMMFLPGLALCKELDDFIPTLKAGGLTVRGVFGEGTAAEGYSYQVSNERTLGKSEVELLHDMVKTTMSLCDLELRAREKLLKEKKLPLRDACLRAYGLLTNCATLTQKELTDGMVKLKLGMALGFFKARDIEAFNDFLANMRPASFRLENRLEGASELDCDVSRAEIVYKVLPELMLRVD
ncbi:MAG: ATP--guanido phosphotransferase [Clostridia bacterium]|nr:ATP--guanido phosphotransferase [Clostridia bacterium]